jgi:hypothetical protein
VSAVLVTGRGGALREIEGVTVRLINKADEAHDPKGGHEGNDLGTSIGQARTSPSPAVAPCRDGRRPHCPP